MPFDQLSLVWQVWGYMLLGAIFMGCGLLVGIEWAWLSFCARAAWTTFRTWCRRTFTAAGDGMFAPAPPRETRLTLIDADEIIIAARDSGTVTFSGSARLRDGRTVRFSNRPIAPHADDTLRRRQLLALAETSPFRKTVH